jgi:hypothetical protein
MKILQKSQVGGGAFGNLVTIAVLAFGVWVAIQYVPQWIESSTVDSVLEKLQTENKSTPANSARQVKKRIGILLNTNQMLDMEKSFSVSQNGNTIQVVVNYERELNLLFMKKMISYEKSVYLE